MEKVKHKKLIPYVIAIGILLAIILIAVFLFYGFKGETKIAEKTIENEKSESITCTINGLEYPFFVYNNATNKAIRVTVTFDGKKLASIYLIHELMYDNEDAAAISETQNHTNMNKSFSTIYGADAFNANYYSDKNTMRMSLYAKANELTEDAKKYFLATGADNSKNSLIKNYQAQGFSCEK